MKRRMMRVETPQLIIPDRKLLDVTRKRVKQSPETTSRDGFHLAGGQSRTSP
jgi:hypothetical protein